MAYYLFQAAYTPEAWAAQVKNPQNRVELLRSFVERLGGKFECAFFSFGEYDALAIFQFPDNVSVGALSVATAAGGAMKAIKTTPLMTIEEGMEMMRKAASSGYRPPA